MDFVRYAESSAALLNAELPDLDALVLFLDQRAWLQPQVNDRDVAVLRRFQRDLRPVFEASSHDDPKGVVDGLNALLEKNPITPRIADHNPANLHIHVANRAASVADLLIGEALLGLANLVCDLGPTRLGICAGPFPAFARSGLGCYHPPVIPKVESNRSHVRVGGPSAARA